MTEEKKLEPELRFPGFHEPWEEKKLGDVFEFKNGINKGKEYFGYGTPIINYMDVNRSTHLLKKDIEGLVFSNESEQKRYSVQKGDVFFTRTSETINEIGLASVLLEDIKNCVYSGFILRGRKIYTNINDLFAGYLYNTENVRIEIMRKSSKTTRALTNGKLLSEVNISTPSIQEQEKIGKFFYAIDKKLDLQRERIEELKSYKKGMMQRIFDQEIRFKDEDGRDYPDWEEKKIRDLGSVYTGKTPSTKERKFWNGDIPFITPTDINSKYTMKTQRYLTEQGSKKSVLIPENSLLITSIASIGKNTINKQVSSCNQQINYIEVNENNSTEFLYYKISYIKNKLLSFAGQTATKILNKREFEDIDIVIPSLPEQEKIANFLSAIDRRIELEEEKLELYEDFKKGLMQRMFV